MTQINAGHGHAGGENTKKRWQNCALMNLKARCEDTYRAAVAVNEIKSIDYTQAATGTPNGKHSEAI